MEAGRNVAMDQYRSAIDNLTKAEARIIQQGKLINSKNEEIDILKGRLVELEEKVKEAETKAESTATSMKSYKDDVKTLLAQLQTITEANIKLVAEVDEKDKQLVELEALKRKAATEEANKNDKLTPEELEDPNLYVLINKELASNHHHLSSVVIIDKLQGSIVHDTPLAKMKYGNYLENHNVASYAKTKAGWDEQLEILGFNFKQMLASDKYVLVMKSELDKMNFLGTSPKTDVSYSTYSATNTVII